MAEQMEFSTLNIGDAVDVETLLNKPTVPKAQSDRDRELDALVGIAGAQEAATKAFPWKPEGKIATARIAALKAVARTGMGDTVFVSTKGDTLWFSQTRLSNKGRAAGSKNTAKIGVPKPGK